jgi:hypothetical protein
MNLSYKQAGTLIGRIQLIYTVYRNIVINYSKIETIIFDMRIYEIL